MLGGHYTRYRPLITKRERTEIPAFVFIPFTLRSPLNFVG